MKIEIEITVTEVEGDDVSYERSWASWCNVSSFPYIPRVGEKFIMTYDDNDPMKIIKIDAVSK